MYTLAFSPQASEDLKELPEHTSRRIREKLKSNAKLDNPLVRAKPLTGLKPVTASELATTERYFLLKTIQSKSLRLPIDLGYMTNEN